MEKTTRGESNNGIWLVNQRWSTEVWKTHFYSTSTQSLDKKLERNLTCFRSIWRPHLCCFYVSKDKYVHLQWCDCPTYFHAPFKLHCNPLEDSIESRVSDNKHGDGGEGNMNVRIKKEAVCPCAEAIVEISPLFSLNYCLHCPMICSGAARSCLFRKLSEDVQTKWPQNTDWRLWIFPYLS